MDKESFELMLDKATAEGEMAVKGMHDGFPCGGAYVIADGRSELVKGMKKWGVLEGSWYKLGDWAMTKNYPSGFMLSNRKNGGYQNMQMHSEENMAYTKVFGLYNIPTRVHTYID